ncbi:MAG: ATP-dependent zinc metalloprotease FtsH [Rhodospirillales bacterium]|nr:ATP-dependent zinc metalloprotease FtsH [Rhodospirillales bacterium]
MFYFFVVKGQIAGRSKAVLSAPGASGVRFADVAGCDAEKEELMEIVHFLRDPGRFDRLGGRVPTGMLMSGPPGTGKTLLARAVAGEAGVPFFSISGSDFVEMYVGVGAQRVRSIFTKAKKKAPCILFIDEIDAVGRSRSSGTTGGAHEEREQTLNQLLVEMDGFKPNGGVIVVAATNRPEILDRALTRPGRFSRHVVLNNPDVAGRKAILEVHCRDLPLDASVDLAVLARGTPGFSGADLANLANEAAIVAARRLAAEVSMADFDEARDRILLGNERRAFVLSEEDRRLTAYHEAGHALVAHHSPASDPIHKVTIVPRGQALGMVVRLPERDTPAVRRSKLEADLAVAMGGRAAEEIIFGSDDVSTGASGDIQMATNLARRMVTEWGMSDKVGMVCYDLAHASRVGSEAFSEETSREIDAEVKRLVALSRDRALAILEDNLEQLHLLADTLLKDETLTGQEVAELLNSATPLRVCARAG